MPRHAYLASLALAACTSVATITPNVCGNDVLDPGEDCDQPTGCTSTCRIACNPTTPTTCTAGFDGTCCPDGMACGADLACHQPTGTMQTNELVQSFDVESFIVADIDGDRIADVVGIGATSPDVLYGDLATPFARTASAVSPPPQAGAQSSFSDITGDGIDDVVIPIAGGLFALDNSSGAPQPISFSVTSTPNVTHERIAIGFTLGSPGSTDFVVFDATPGKTASHYNFALSVIQPPNRTTYAWNQLSSQATFCAVANPDSTIAEGVRGRAIHPFCDGNALECVLNLSAPIRVPLMMKEGLCVATANPSALDSSYLVATTTWTTPGYAAVEGDGETFFANLISAAGKCPDLVTPMSKGGGSFTMIVPGSGISGVCGVDTSSPVFLAGLPFAAMTMAGSPALITGAGIYTSFTTGAVPVVLPTRTWRYAAVADLNGDKLDDFVTVGTDSDVEVFFQRPEVLTQPEFSVVDVPTTNTVQKVELGNFDGDNAGDVAIATSDPTITNGPTDLAIAWGSVDESFTVSDVGLFDEANDVVALNLIDASLPVGDDQNEDLLVVRGGATQSTTDPALLIAEYGSTSRTLTAPYIYLHDFGNGNGNQPAASAGLVGGRFGANDGPAIFSYFLPQNADTTQTVPGAAANLTDQSNGSMIASAPFSSTTNCGLVDPTSTASDSYFCPAKSRLLTLREATGNDLMLALRGDAETGTANCMQYFVANDADSTAAPAVTTIACQDVAPAAATSTDPDVMLAYQDLTNVTVRLLDNDGTTAHLCIGTEPTGEWEAFDWTLTVVAGQPQLSSPLRYNTELAAAIQATIQPSCEQAIEMELGTRVIGGVTYGDNAKETVLACAFHGATSYDMQLWARYADPNSGPPHYEMLWDAQTIGGFTMRVGDINGDGLDDLLFLNGGAFGSGKLQLHAIMQCDAHQTDCTGGGS